MKTIVSIGGVDENSSLDFIEEELIRLSKKKNPKLLHLPTASGDDTRNYELVKRIFETNYKCDVEALFLIKEEPTEKEIIEKVFSSDIIYIGGGSVFTLMDYLKKNNMRQILKSAYEKGIVLAGVSAGAICWGKDYLDIHTENHNIIECLGFLDLIFRPHYNMYRHQNIVKEFENRINENDLKGIGLDNNCAIEFVEDKYRVITTKDSANAYKVYKKDSKLIRKVIKKDSKFRHISELY